MLSMDEIRNLKVADLKNELKQRNLSIAGKKAELVSRLEAFLKEAKDGEVSLIPKHSFLSVALTNSNIKI